jgi:hypothetical protein
MFRFVVDADGTSNCGLQPLFLSFAVLPFYFFQMPGLNLNTRPQYGGKLTRALMEMADAHDMDNEEHTLLEGVERYFELITFKPNEV